MKQIQKDTQVAQVSANIADLQSGTSVTEVNKETNQDKKFSLATALKISQKIAKEEARSAESSTDLMIAPSYKLSDRLSLAAKAIVSKDNAGPKNTTVSNTTLTLSIKGIELQPGLKTVHSVGAVIPTNEESKKRDRLQTSFSLTNGLSWQIPYAKIDYRLGLSKNIHEFTFNAEGSANVEYRISNALDVLLPITDKFSFTSSGIYRIGKTYGGFDRFGFEWHNDINYDVTEKLAINLGVSNDGKALKSNGVDSNISAYNENTSVTRAGLSYNY